MAHLASRQQHVLRLYREALRTCLSWRGSRQHWFQEAREIRDQFEENRHVSDLGQIDRLIKQAEAELKEFTHPDPLRVPYVKGGSLYHRNPPIPTEMTMTYDYGREETY
ncbi:hypothetical protein BSKO_11823 [Bryopsis sp. KO-2023]|nr:hypothetical protein BSKO_11823 [Bryopsis sp. KO-2023]